MTRRQKDDWYPTPPEATQALLDVEIFTGSEACLWEPCCGDGAISKVVEANGYQIQSTDLNDYDYGDQTGVDFLMETKRLGDAIITNPPYKLATEFIKHAIDLGVKKHCWLLRLSFLEGQARYDSLFHSHPPARIYVFSKRLTIWRGDEEVAGSGTVAYAWFVWKQGYRATPMVSWI